MMVCATSVRKINILVMLSHYEYPLQVTFQESFMKENLVSKEEHVLKIQEFEVHEFTISTIKE